MIHRALMGSYERFIGILLEDTAGELPLWLAPVQAIVLPIADRHTDAARTAAELLAAAGPARRGGRPHGVRRAARSATRSCARCRT
jgi:threonyl-tRNA synthetase